jgi:hypothetical protein
VRSWALTQREIKSFDQKRDIVWLRFLAVLAHCRDAQASVVKDQRR